MKLIVLISALVFGLSAAATAKDYTIGPLDIHAEIHEDGTVRISENRTFHFEGSYFWVEWRISKDGFAELRDIRVFDSGTELFVSEDESPGTFRLSTSNRYITVRWFIDATDESRQFSIDYTVAGGFSVGHEWTEFYWDFIGTGWEKPTNDITIEIDFPVEGRDDQIHVWSRNALPGETLSREAGRIVYSALNIRQRRALSLQTVFPSDWIETEVNTQVNINPEHIQQGYERVIQEREHREAVQARRQPVADAAGVLLIILSIIFTGYMLIRFGRSEEPAMQISSWIDHPPTDHRPAIIGWLLYYRTISGHHLAATILDLARRGYFRIKQEKKGKGTLFSPEKDEYLLEATGNKSDELTEWEKKLHDFLLKRIEAGKNSFSELFKEDTKVFSTGSGISGWMEKWNKMVADDAKSKGWIVSQPAAVWTLVLVQLVILIGCIFIIFWGSTPAYGIVGCIAAGLGIVMSGFLFPRTAEGQKVYKQWKIYRDALKNGRVSEEPEFKSRHIVYAVALGIAGKQFKQLTANIGITDNDMTWFILMPGTTFSPAAFSGAVSSMASSTTASVTSVSAGTGAVAGSAGGGTGGGAG